MNLTDSSYHAKLYLLVCKILEIFAHEDFNFLRFVSKCTEQANKLALDNFFPFSVVFSKQSNNSPDYKCVKKCGHYNLDSCNSCETTIISLNLLRCMMMQLMMEVFKSFQLYVISNNLEQFIENIPLIKLIHLVGIFTCQSIFFEELFSYNLNVYL